MWFVARRDFLFHSCSVKCLLNLLKTASLFIVSEKPTKPFSLIDIVFAEALPSRLSALVSPIASAWVEANSAASTDKLLRQTYTVAINTLQIKRLMPN
jgi:hypothetical protein